MWHCGKWGRHFFGVWKMEGGRDIIRKYTFEGGARPAAGTASNVIRVFDFSGDCF